MSIIKESSDLTTVPIDSKIIFLKVHGNKNLSSYLKEILKQYRKVYYSIFTTALFRKVF